MLPLQPTTAGSATAIALIYPGLKGKLNGHAIRAPILNASLTDSAFELKRETSPEEVNELFKVAARGPLAEGAATQCASTFHACSPLAKHCRSPDVASQHA